MGSGSRDLRFCVCLTSAPGPDCTAPFFLPQRLDLGGFTFSFHIRLSSTLLWERPSALSCSRGLRAQPQHGPG